MDVCMFLMMCMDVLMRDATMAVPVRMRAFTIRLAYDPGGIGETKPKQ